MGLPMEKPYAINMLRIGWLPMGDPWATHGQPMGHPWVTHGMDAGIKSMGDH